jgi:hypothetical protein
MPKIIDDIIVPEKRRSIRDIPIPEGRRKDIKHVSSPAPKEIRSFLNSRNGFDMPEEHRPPKRSKKGLWVAIGISLLIIIFAILSLFNSATLAYVPKSQTLSFNNANFTAEKTGEAKLLYSVAKLSKDKGAEVSTTGEASVERKASGIIVVYNDAGTESQKLVENTRFETAEGLVYRIKNAITVPGRKTVNGTTQPGSLEVTVYADEAGDKYNIGLADFTLPGLAGTSRFSTIYARSKTEMIGGFVGRESVIKDQDRTQARSKLETLLKEELLSEAKAQVPKDFILFPSLSYVTFEDLPQTEASGKGRVMVNLRAHLYGVMFKRNDLSNFLTSEKITLASEEAVDISSLDDLKVAFVGVAPSDLPRANEIKFTVTGEVTAIWRADEVALKADLVGKHEKDIPSILNNYPTVISATATIKPFWKNSFPSDAERISVKKLPVQ